MKPGSKYYPLFNYLQTQEGSEVNLSIPEIESILNGELPSSARTKKTWWSNRSSGALQASAWVNAGYHTKDIDLTSQKVTFRKFKATYEVKRADGKIVWDSDAIRALRHHMGMTQVAFAEHLGIRQQTVSEWENGLYEPKRSTTKYLDLVAGQVAFNPNEIEAHPSMDETA